MESVEVLSQKNCDLEGEQNLLTDDFDTDDENLPPPVKKPRLDSQAVLSEFENA